MSKQKKIITAGLGAFVVLVAIVVAGTWLILRQVQVEAAGGISFHTQANSQPPLPEFQVASFSLTDQLGKTITNDNLKGHVWIAAFIYTRCTQLCPMMSAEMRTLQTKIPNKAIKFVSFSVDPKHDTPAVLKAYAQKYNADPSRWILLTGNPQTIENVASSLKLGVALGENPNEMTHSDKFVLIGPDGKSRGIYTGIDDIAVNKLATDAEKLASGKPVSGVAD